MYIVFPVQKLENEGGAILLSESKTMNQMNMVIIQYHGYISNNIYIYICFYNSGNAVKWIKMQLKNKETLRIYI